MSDLRLKVSITPTDAARRIENYVVHNGTSTELVGHSVYVNDEGYSSIMLVFEKYYMRNSSRASLSVNISNIEGDTKVYAVGSGGGQGLFMKFDWGAGDDFVGSVRRALDGCIV